MEGTRVGLDPTDPFLLNLNEVVLRTLQHPRNRQSRDITITVELAQNPPMVSIEQEELESIVLALLANAENAIDDGQVRPGQIQVKTAVQSQRVHLTVTDNGRGIHWREMARLFDVQSRDAILTRCADTLKENGGELYAWSNYGSGSIFTLELPVQDALEASCGSAERTGLHGKRILVIDDEIQISTLMFEMLEKEGAQIDLANSGVQAVERIKTRQYDLLICDQRMPDLSGERLYRSIESMHPELVSRFLFVTGEVMNDDVRNFFTETRVLHIRKPFRTVELLSAAEQVLSRNQRYGF